MSPGIFSLILPAVAAGLAARRVAGPENVAARIAAWFVLFASIAVLPIHGAAVLQLLGTIARIPVGLPAVVGGVIAAVLLARGRESYRLQRPTSEWRAMNAAACLGAPGQAMMIIAGAYAVFALDRLSSYPSSWDGTAYHLPLAVKWLQEGSLTITQNTDWRDSLPANGDILAMLALATGWQALAEMWNISSTLGLCAGSYLFAQGIGVARPGALAGAVLVAGVPLVLFQTFSSYVDLFGSACLIAGVGLFVTSRSANAVSISTSWALALSGLACGLAVGTKPTFWPPAALVAAGVLAWIVGSRTASRRRGGLILLFVAATAAPCLFWFLRGLVATGNPFYPLAVEIPGFVSLRGFRQITASDYHLNFVRSKSEWLLYPWIEFKRSGYNFSTGSGLGPLFAAFVPVGVLYTLWSFRRLAPGTPRTIRLAGVAGFVVSGAVWWFLVQGTLRFALPVIVLACILATPFIDDVLRARPRATRVLLVGSAILSAILSVLPVAEDIPRRIRHQLWERHRFYDIPQLVDQLPACSVVVNYNPIGEFWNSFALAGRRLTNTVAAPWEARQAVERPENRACPTYVLDREPFMSDEEARHLGVLGYSTLDLSPETRWRIWTRTAR